MMGRKHKGKCWLGEGPPAQGQEPEGTSMPLGRGAQRLWWEWGWGAEGAGK